MVTSVHTPKTVPDAVLNTGADGWGGGSSQYQGSASVLTTPGAKQAAKRLFEASPAGPSSRVLDIGCGTGVATRAVTEQAPGVPVVATDLSKGMVESTASMRLPSVTTRVADAYDLQASGLEKGSFSHVISTFCLQFSPDPEKGVAQMHDILQPGGTLALGTWRRLPFLESFIQACRNLDPTWKGIDDSGWREPWRELENVTRSMEAVGFDVLSTDMVYAPMVFKTRDEPIEYIFDGRNPVIQALLDAWPGDPQEPRDELSRMLETMPNRTFEDVEAMITVGRKKT